VRVSTAASLTDVGNRLSKIYTRTGDDGSTGLGDGSRVQKDSLRVTAYGTVDELNSTIGMVLASEGVNDAVRETLTQVQHELFDLGGELCIPGMAMIDDADIDGWKPCSTASTSRCRR
jgi:cob(I)alamin adenosyltransferase